MARVVAKLFRDLTNAEWAAKELKARGYGANEIGILTRDKEAADKLANIIGGLTATEVDLSGIGRAIAMGLMARLLTEVANDDPQAALFKALETIEETYKYWEFGISVGGVLLSVHTEDGRIPQAREILRLADRAGDRMGRWASSPGFAKASRMSATNPIDAPMSGDFRKY